MLSTRIGAKLVKWFLINLKKKLSLKQTLNFKKEKIWIHELNYQHNQESSSLHCERIILNQRNNGL